MLANRLMARVSKDTDGCWRWTGYVDKDGYGQISVDGYPHKTHRVAWEVHCGPIPDGKMVLHRCDHPPCVNPAHLWLGTALDNNRDRDAKGRNGFSRKTHCPKGHSFDDSNTYFDKKSGCRQCKRCKKSAWEAWYARQRADG